MDNLTGYRTYISIIVAVLPSILGLFGYRLAEGSSEQVSDLLSEIVTIGGSAAAFYFRAKATTKGFLVK